MITKGVLSAAAWLAIIVLFSLDPAGGAGRSAGRDRVALSSPPRVYDYNGDGTTEIGIFRPSSGLWSIRGVTRLYFGSPGDTVAPGDYAGNGTTAIGIFRSSAGLWAIRGITRVYFGGSNDIPLPRDYSGDGRVDIGVYRPAAGLWAVRGLTRVYFGSSSDRPVPGYYRDNRAQAAIFRPSSGLWAVRGVTRAYFGSSNDTPVPRDYSGSGSWGPAIFRSSAGLWSARGVTRAYFGSSSDTPAPGGYAGDGTDRMGVFRPSSGLWAIRKTTRVYFGTQGDIPVSAPPAAGSSGDVLYQENFNSGTAAGWSPDTSVDWHVQTETYQAFRPVPPGIISMVSTYGGQVFTNFSYEVKLRKDANNGPGGGLVFRASSDFEQAPCAGTGYSFMILEGFYFLDKMVNDAYTVLRPWTGSEYLNYSPNWNTLKVTAYGSSLSFYINSHLVYTVEDSDITSGRIGVWGYTEPDIGVNKFVNHWYFDDVLVTK